MQDKLLTVDEKLTARLQACRRLFLRLDAGTGENVKVSMPDGELMSPGLQAGGGLKAAGAVLSYALLGRESADALAEMEQLSQETEDRSLRRVCQMAASMLKEDPGFSQASLYAALRTAVVFLPEGGEAGELPGLIRQAEEKKMDPSLPPVLSARYTWAGDAAIAYFDLPEGVESAEIAGESYTRAQCRGGVCLPPAAEEIPVRMGEEEAALRPLDPWRGLRMQVGFRVWKGFVPVLWVPRALWEKMTPWMRVTGPRTGRVPAAKLITSCGETQERECALTRGAAYLKCPALDPARDEYVKVVNGGVRYVDFTGEG